MASSLASTMQQMSMSFGVAVASLTTAVFIPDRFHNEAGPMVHGIHKAFVCLGTLTVLSALVFRELKPEDGATVSEAVAGRDGTARLALPAPLAAGRADLVVDDHGIERTYPGVDYAGGDVIDLS